MIFIIHHKTMIYQKNQEFYYIFKFLRKLNSKYDIMNTNEPTGKTKIENDEVFYCEISLG